MTEHKKQIVATMLTHICQKDRPEAACPFFVVDPSCTELCPAGISDSWAHPPCLKMTKEKWLKWMEEEDTAISGATFDFPKLKESVAHVDNSLSEFIEEAIKRAAHRP